jgi:uncharacterized cupredoxin-like copper-binding protein
MHVTRLGTLLAIAALVAACAGGDATPAPAPATDAPPATPTVSPAAEATRIEVSLTDALTIEPGSMAVPAGVPVTFVVTNAGMTEHEFFLGDEAAQAEHEEEMAGMGGMAHDEEMGIGLEPGETKELTVTFEEPGTILAGCHVAGHYAAGMKASVEVSR